MQPFDCVADSVAAIDDFFLSFVSYALVRKNSTLASHIDKGDNQKARLLALMAALRLNRLSWQQNETQSELRKLTRTELLYHIKDLPLRDMVRSTITRHGKIYHYTIW